MPLSHYMDLTALTQISPHILVFFLKKIYTLIGDNMELSKLKEEYNQLKNNLNLIGRSL